MGDHTAIRHRIPGTRGRLRPVGVHPEVSGARAADIASEQKELMPTGQGHAVGGTHVTGMGEEQLRRQRAGTDQFLRPVEVAENGVQQRGPLGETNLQHVPVGGVEQQRKPIQTPRHRMGGRIGPGHRSRDAPGIHVGDAVTVDQSADTIQQTVQTRTAALRDGVGQVGPGRADVAVGRQELVVPCLTAPPSDLEQCSLGASAAVLRDQRVIGQRVAGSGGSPRSRCCHRRYLPSCSALSPASHRPRTA